jgi:hypothetical protein
LTIKPIETLEEKFKAMLEREEKGIQENTQGGKGFMLDEEER